MKTETIHINAGRIKGRALEFYSGDTPFRPKRVELKTRYKRKSKHPKSEW